MKTKSIIFALLACLTLGFSSCEDMLEAKSERHSYETATDTLYSYWGILKTLQNLGERYVLLGELRGDLVSPTEYVSDSIAAIAEFENPQDGDCRYLRASDFYAVINNCNAYLAAADTARPIFGANAGMKYMLREYAQVWAIRAWTYMQLVQLYGDVPFYTEPLTSLAEVESFYNGGNCKRVNRFTLASEIEKEAGERLLTLLDQDEPEYGNYGMVYAKYCMFPLKAVMGDLWLIAAQSKAEYEKAAQYYYDYLRKTKAVLPSNYDCSIITITYMSGEEELRYSTSGQYKIFTEAQSEHKDTKEAITVIPGTTNRQWGIVQTGVNDVFGFTAQVSVVSSSKNSKNDTIVTSASVNLSFNPEPQCTGSEAFLALTKAYPAMKVKGIETDENNKDFIRYETYKQKVDGEEVDAPDARRAWLVNEHFMYNGERLNVDYIEKQNPLGVYTTSFPVIYRKAAIWLRLAEAINRAGYPEYAFAILADGLDENFMPRLVSTTSTEISDYVVNCAELPDTLGNLYQCHEVLIDGLKAMYDEDPGLYASEPVVKTYRLSTEDLEDSQLLQILAQGPALVAHNRESQVHVRGSEQPVQGAITTGLYIPINQALKANDVPFLRFDDVNFRFSTTSTSTSSFVSSYTHGVHSRGNNSNMLSIASDTLCPYYNFDVCVKQKWDEYPGRLNYYAVDKADYEAYQARLIEAVEDLIIDEMGLEMCFEGGRFSDLLRVAERRNSPEWLARKIAARKTGDYNDDPTLYSKLLNKKNWYLELPRF